MNSETTFQLPPELQDVPTEYSMSHITFDDVNGILSLVEIALSRGSIKGDELTILNQIRNDCVLEVQDYQAWVQKRNQVVAIEGQLLREEAEAKRQKELEGAKATADAKIQSAQEAAKILQNRVVELENQIKARNISPVDSDSDEETIRQAMKPQTSHLTVDKIDSNGVSKAFQAARANNPVQTISNQPTEPVHNTIDSMMKSVWEEDLEEDLTPSLNDELEKQMNLWDEAEANSTDGSTLGMATDELYDLRNKALRERKSRMDIIGQNGNDGDHYSEVEDNVEPLFQIEIGQDGNVPLGEQVTEDDINANVTEMELDIDDFEPIEGDGEIEVEVTEDPESVAEVQAMKDAIADEEDDYEEIVIPNSMELKKMTKGKIAEIGTALGFEISESQTKDAMIKDFEEESWNLIETAKADEGMTVTTDEDIIRDGGYFGEDETS